jgi:hypothetical protein
MILLREVFSIKVMTYIREGIAGTCIGLSQENLGAAMYWGFRTSVAPGDPSCDALPPTG